MQRLLGRSRSTRGALLVALGIVLLGAAGLIGGTSVLADDPPPPVLAAPTVTDDGSGSCGCKLRLDPLLSSDQITQVDSIASSDPNVASMLAAAGSYTVSSTSTWDESGNLAGGIATFSFSTPQTLTGTWAVVDDSTSPYTVSTQSFTTVQGATAIDAWVDLTTGQVVAVGPEGNVTTS